MDNLDPNAVLGFFTWNPRSWFHNNEIDIELSSWGQHGNQNGQYVVQPHYYPDHMHRFYFNQEGNYSTHEFVWIPNSVLFRSYHGHRIEAEELPEITKWRFNGLQVPRPRNTHIRLNLWLNNPTGLQNEGRLEIVIKRFIHIPLSAL